MKYFLFFITAILPYTVLGQSKLPVLKATSVNAQIKDGDYAAKSNWTLSPETKPDVYTADRTRETKWVTFYTNIDSIRIKVKPGTVFDFIVLLNGKDSCCTQIKSAIPPKNKSDNTDNNPDTIPFILTAYNAISVKAIINESDSLNLHFDVGSFDFRLTKDAILNKTKLLVDQSFVTDSTLKPNYNNLKKVYKIQMGNLVFNNPEFAVTGFTAHDMDGRFGWNVFEGKVVEIDYDKSLIIIHSKLPSIGKGYRKSKINFMQSFVCMSGTIEIENIKYKGEFLFDTGADQAMILDSSWLSIQKFPANLKLLNTLTFKDPRGVKYETKVVEIPALNLNGFQVSSVPASLMNSANPVRFEVNYFGNDLLKRFNTFIDFMHDNIYLKPNHLMNQPYLENPKG